VYSALQPALNTLHRLRHVVAESLALTLLAFPFLVIQAGANAPAAAAAPAPDHLNAGGSLHPGQQLQSHNGRYTLVLQTDGNLVLYDHAPSGTTARWATATAGRTVVEAVMQADGNFVLYSKPGYNAQDAVWATKSDRNAPAHLILQDDGNLVVYADRDNNVLWAAGVAESSPTSSGVGSDPSAGGGSAQSSGTPGTLPSGGGLPPVHIVSNCGIVTCSLYLSRAETKWLNDNVSVDSAVGGSAPVAVLCSVLIAATIETGPGAAIVGGVCTAEGLIDVGFLTNAISHAATSHGCLRLRGPGLPGMVWFYADHSEYCRD
jgi:hypothetical protein